MDLRRLDGTGSLSAKNRQDLDEVAVGRANLNGQFSEQLLFSSANDWQRFLSAVRAARGQSGRDFVLVELPRGAAGEFCAAFFWADELKFNKKDVNEALPYGERVQVVDAKGTAIEGRVLVANDEWEPNALNAGHGTLMGGAGLAMMVLGGIPGIILGTASLAFGAEELKGVDAAHKRREQSFAPLSALTPPNEGSKTLKSPLTQGKSLHNELQTVARENVWTGYVLGELISSDRAPEHRDAMVHGSYYVALYDKLRNDPRFDDVRTDLQAYWPLRTADALRATFKELDVRQQVKGGEPLKASVDALSDTQAVALAHALSYTQAKTIGTYQVDAITGLSAGARALFDRVTADPGYAAYLDLELGLKYPHPTEVDKRAALSSAGQAIFSNEIDVLPESERKVLWAALNDPRALLEPESAAIFTALLHTRRDDVVPMGKRVIDWTAKVGAAKLHEIVVARMPELP